MRLDRVGVVGPDQNPPFGPSGYRDDTRCLPPFSDRNVEDERLRDVGRGHLDDQGRDVGAREIRTQVQIGYLRLTRRMSRIPLAAHPQESR